MANIDCCRVSLLISIVVWLVWRNFVSVYVICRCYLHGFDCVVLSEETQYQSAAWWKQCSKYFVCILMWGYFLTSRDGGLGYRHMLFHHLLHLLSFCAR